MKRWCQNDHYLVNSQIHHGSSYWYNSTILHGHYTIIKDNLLKYKMEEDLYKHKLRFMHMHFLNLLICHFISLKIHSVMQDHSLSEAHVPIIDFIDNSPVHEDLKSSSIELQGGAHFELYIIQLLRKQYLIRT